MPEILEAFQDAKLSRDLLTMVRKLAAAYREKHGRPMALMEVCGTHTMALARSGIREAVAGEVRLVSGPGCPVCVTSQDDIHRMQVLAAQREAIVCTFGDMMRVPGREGSLQDTRARGGDVRVIYNPVEAVAIAAANPNRPVVFFGIGFETTIPTVAAALVEAERQQITNFYLFTAFKLVTPVLHYLLTLGEVRLDGLLLPGHVSVILGEGDFTFLADQYRVPSVISGFLPVDMLGGIALLLQMGIRGEAQVKNAYPRVVRYEGNPTAKGLVSRYFVPADTKWRGIGIIPGSGLALKPQWEHRDCRYRWPHLWQLEEDTEIAGCRCGEILRGVITPHQCPRFATDCTPVDPVGPCMVSSEGTCAAYYQHLRLAGHREKG